jgi:hypothetical protein
MTLSEQKSLVADFLAQCNRYADGKLDEYRQRLATASGRQALEIQDKITHWTAYRVFNEHAIEELQSGALDDWFPKPAQE